MGWMEENKKSGAGMWVASHSTHIPRRPKKKPLRGKKVGFAEEKLRLWRLAWAAGWVDFEGRAQNIAPLHLMRCLIAGYNLVGALQGRAQNIAPLQVGGIVAVVAVVAIDAIEAIVAIVDIVDIVDMGFGGCGLGGMEEIKKSASPKKKPLRGKKLWLWGLAWAKRGARQKIV